jgi:predicted transglutaminase-like cysteine proteinase
MESCTCAQWSRRRLLAGVAAAGLAGVIPRGSAAAAESTNAPPSEIPRLFGWGETAVGDPRRYVPKSRVLDRAMTTPAQPMMAASGGAAGRWERLLAALAAQSPEAQIAGVDRFANAIAWVEDARLYGQADHWATPAEFLAAEAGDCEDFAIAKYAALSRLGFCEERLRIALVYDRRRRLEHALTIVYWRGDALVLDSLAAPRSHAEITRYRPICSFNRQQLWVHKAA